MRAKKRQGENGALSIRPIISAFVSFLLASSLAFTQQSNASEKPNQCLFSAEALDHVRLSTPVIKAWQNVLVGSPVYVLDDAAGTKDWLQCTQIQRITFQTGIWYIHIERGYTVFRIYPYLSKESPQPSAYQGVVIKVNGTLSEADLIAAIRNRISRLKIDEYEFFGANHLSVQKYSRHHDAPLF